MADHPFRDLDRPTVKPQLPVGPPAARPSRRTPLRWSRGLIAGIVIGVASGIALGLVVGRGLSRPPGSAGITSDRQTAERRVPPPPDRKAVATARNPVVEAMEANRADQFHRRLAEMIGDFDASLDQDHEVGVRLTGVGQAVAFRLAGLGFYNPSLVTFSGHTEDGSPVHLIQHVSQISIVLTKLKRPDPSTPKEPRAWLHPFLEQSA